MTKLLTSILIVVVFAVPYVIGGAMSWWRFIPSAVLIIGLRYWAAPKTFLTDLGLKFDKSESIAAVLIFIGVYIPAVWIIPYLLNLGSYTSSPLSNHLGWRYISVFQVLNEEMLLRALLLTSLSRLVPRDWVLNVSVALFFTALHFGFYRFSSHQTVLLPTTLFTLFMFSYACNSLFLTTKSILVPFAIHLGWNIPKFGGLWIHRYSGEYLNEGGGFNLVEGNLTVTAFASLLGVIALCFERYRTRHSTPQPKRN